MQTRIDFDRKLDEARDVYKATQGLDEIVMDVQSAVGYLTGPVSSYIGSGMAANRIPALIEERPEVLPDWKLSGRVAKDLTCVLNAEVIGPHSRYEYGLSALESFRAKAESVLNAIERQPSYLTEQPASDEEAVARETIERAIDLSCTLLDQLKEKYEAEVGIGERLSQVEQQLLGAYSELVLEPIIALKPHVDGVLDALRKFGW